ncbi:MAG: alpha/beta fold hydrolase, partial [Anaerolineales bacterium]|nr:alpha/beta fold hydrolase [Anaerolineales bacterium]
ESFSSNPAPDPLIILHGGPGAPGLGRVKRLLGPEGERLRADRDVVFIDQRGTNFSEPALYCPEFKIETAKALGMSFIELRDLRLKNLQACHDRLISKGINLAAYNVLESAADIHDLCLAMGYEQVNLYGVSYGTRLAMHIMRLYPGVIRSVVLDSIIPPEVNFIKEGLNSTQSALSALFECCAADPVCNRTFPDLESVFYEVVGRLRAEPIHIVVEDDAGTSYDVLIDDLKLVDYIRNKGNDTPADTERPWVIYRAYREDYRPLALALLRMASAELNDYRPGSLSMSDGAHFSGHCADDGSCISQKEASALYNQPHANISVRRWVDLAFGVWSAASEFWRAARLDPIVLRKPLESDIPTLMLAGTFDPQTPPFFGRPCAKRLEKCYFFEFPVGHGVLRLPCALGIVESFINDPTKEPDSSCIDDIKIEWKQS